MCRRVACERCGKPTWAGCGAHVDRVLGDVPVKDRCQCRSTAASSPLLSSGWSVNQLLCKQS